MNDIYVANVQLGNIGDTATITHNFSSNTEGFVFKDRLSGTTSTNGYWTAGQLNMDGLGSWGEAYWRLELDGAGVQAVNGVSKVKVHFHSPGNCFTQANIWWNDTDRTYSVTSSGSPNPIITTADRNQSVYALGVQCNIYNDGWYTYKIELVDFENLRKPVLYTYGVQLGSRGSSDIFTNGVRLG